MKVYGDTIRLKALQTLISEADVHCYPGLDDNSKPNVTIMWKNQSWSAPDVFGLLDTIITDMGEQWLASLLQKQF